MCGVQAWAWREGRILLLAWMDMHAEGGLSINSMQGWGTVAWDGREGVPSPFGGGRDDLAGIG